MAKLGLIRHAHVTVDPRVPVDQWRLSEEGIKAAAALLRDPALAEVQLVYTSPEPKAVATAAAISGRQPLIQVTDLKELDRTAAGWLSTEAEYVAMVAEIFRHPDQSIRGCEPAALAQQRIVRAIDTLVAAHPGRPLAIISHGIVLALYMCHLKRLMMPDPAIWRRIGFPDLALVDPGRRAVIVDFHG
ncbi:MAG TPA: histidine phosphatase family protein [Chloroflexota bacterium]|nr:histidine phosphatase family protein [Chloroflexota bacterium]